MTSHPDRDDVRGHPGGCFCCAPSLLSRMIENAGLEMSRRGFLMAAAAGAATLVGLPGCAATDGTVAPAQADAIYHGGPIRTMTSEGARVEALAVQNGRIVAVGTLDEVMTKKGPNTEMVDLRGKTLMPGFFDPHSHVALQSAKFATANLDLSLIHI